MKAVDKVYRLLLKLIHRFFIGKKRSFNILCSHVPTFSLTLRKQLLERILIFFLTKRMSVDKVYLLFAAKTYVTLFIRKNCSFNIVYNHELTYFTDPTSEKFLEEFLPNLSWPL